MFSRPTFSRPSLVRNEATRVIMTTIVAVALVASGYVAGLATSRVGWASSASPDEPSDVVSSFGVFWQAWNLAEQRYVERQSLDTTKMTYGAIEGMLDALGDQGHTRFLSPDDVQSERQALSGQLVGIGVQVEVKEGHPTVVAPISGSPAQQAGIKSGDVIVAVDGQSVEGLTITQVSRLIRGPEGQPVRLSLVHLGDSAPTDITIVRATITVPSVTWVLLPGTTTAQVLVSQFSDHTTDQLAQAIGAAESAGATALILDLRNDPGGIRDEAVGVASQFLADGNVLIEQNAQGEQHPYAVKAGGVATTVPLAVLINEGSASSAEIVAGAIQDHQRARLIGATTFGTGTVLEQFPLADGSAIYLGTAEWLTPNGRQIWHHGIAPDDTVPLPASARPLTPDDVRSLSAADLAASQDAQLLDALKVLGQQAAGAQAEAPAPAQH
jgi:carboxyl-terminal processing protease